MALAILLLLEKSHSSIKRKREKKLNPHFQRFTFPALFFYARSRQLLCLIWNGSCIERGKKYSIYIMYYMTLSVIWATNCTYSYEAMYIYTFVRDLNNNPWRTTKWTENDEKKMKRNPFSAFSKIPSCCFATHSLTHLLMLNRSNEAKALCLIRGDGRNEHKNNTTKNRTEREKRKKWKFLYENHNMYLKGDVWMLKLSG